MSTPADTFNVLIVANSLLMGGEPLPPGKKPHAHYLPGLLDKMRSLVFENISDQLKKEFLSIKTHYHFLKGVGIDPLDASPKFNEKYINLCAMPEFYDACLNAFDEIQNDAEFKAAQKNNPLPPIPENFRREIELLLDF